MEGDQIDNLFERKMEEFINNLDRPKKPAESAAASAMAKPVEEVVDSLTRNVGPLNGHETKVTASPWFNEQKQQVRTPGEYDAAELEIRFTYHAPDAEKITRHRDVRVRCWALADFLCGACPPSRELSIALTKVEEVMLWANAAIARRG